MSSIYLVKIIFCTIEAAKSKMTWVRRNCTYRSGSATLDWKGLADAAVRPGLPAGGLVPRALPLRGRPQPASLQPRRFCHGLHKSLIQDSQDLWYLSRAENNLYMLADNVFHMTCQFGWSNRDRLKMCRQHMFWPFDIFCIFCILHLLYEICNVVEVPWFLLIFNTYLCISTVSFVFYLPCTGTGTVSCRYCIMYGIGTLEQSALEICRTWQINVLVVF